MSNEAIIIIGVIGVSSVSMLGVGWSLIRIWFRAKRQHLRDMLNSDKEA